MRRLTIFLLIIGIQFVPILFICAQSSLDKIIFYNNIELAFTYKSNQLSSITSMGPNLNGQIDISYNENGRIQSVDCKTTNNYYNYSLDFIYEANQLDTVYLLSELAPSYYVFIYDIEKRLEKINRFHFINGDFYLIFEKEFIYNEGLIKEINTKEIYDINNIEDYGFQKNKFSYKNGLLEHIYNSYDASNGHAESFFYFDSEDRLKKKHHQYLNGRNEISSENDFTFQFSSEKKWTEIQNPFELIGLFEQLELSIPNFNSNIDLRFFDNNLFVKVLMNENEFAEFIFDNTSTYLKEKEEIMTYIYPNPVKDFLSFNSEFMPKNVLIFNAKGELMCKMNMIRESVNLAHLPNGNYFIHAEDETGNKVNLQFTKIN